MASSCSICLSTTAENADRGWCVLSKCGHTFHADCLSQACASNPRCPNCREGICLRQTDRDGSVLRRNLVLPIRLDLSGEDGSQLQQSLSPASDRLKRQLAAAQAECRTLEDALEQRESTSRQQLQQLQLALNQSEQVLQGTQDKLAAAREEAHTQKRQLAAQLKDERSQRRTAESLAERLQAVVDRHQLSTDTSLSRSDLVQIAMRHGKAGRDADIFADAIRARDDRNQQVLCDKEREAARSEQQLRRSEHQLADRTAAIQRLQAELRAEQEARRAAEAQRQAAGPTASAAAAPAPAQPSSAPGDAQPSKASGASPHTAQQLAPDDEWLELDDEEEAGVETPLEAQRLRQPLQHRPAAIALDAGGHTSFLGAMAPRDLAEPSFMQRAANTSTSGTFIREGPDGRGGRTKVLMPSIQTFMTSARQKGVRAKAPMPPVPAIKRHKGPSARGGGAITIQHFFDAAEQDTGCGDENGPPQRGY